MNFGQAKALNFERLLRYQKVMDCYDFWICCESLNEKNCKPNFVSFGIKLKELWIFLSLIGYSVKQLKQLRFGELIEWVNFMSRILDIL